MIEHDVHIWRMGSSSYELLQSFEYHWPPSYVTCFSSNKNLLSRIPKLSFPETVFDLENTVKSSSTRPMVHVEQEPIAVGCHIPCGFRRSGDMFLDPRMRTGATGKAQLVKPKCWRFTFCDEDSPAWKWGNPLCWNSSGKVLNKSLKITESEEVEQAASLFLKKAKSWRSTLRRDMWQSPRGPQPV